jgi:hypothetical protein
VRSENAAEMTPAATRLLRVDATATKTASSVGIGFERPNDTMKTW